MDAAFQPYEGQEPYIFISYARKDKDRVVPFMNALHEAGYRVWYDAGIHPAEDWADVIAKQVDRCAVCVAFLSAASAESVHCKAELHRARKKNCQIVPVYLEDRVNLSPGLEMYLDLWQSVNLSWFDTPEAFAAQLGEVAVFAACREPGWYTFWNIQWLLKRSGTLTIKKKDTLKSWDTVSMPDFQRDKYTGGFLSTAPWMSGWENIISVKIEDSIDAIGNRAFYQCRNLNSVHISDSVTKIGIFAFYRCVGLTSVHIPDSVAIIKGSAFADCENLTSVEIPAGVEVADNAFPAHTCVTRRKSTQ